jgi:hypothetical protein
MRVGERLSGAQRLVKPASVRYGTPVADSLIHADNVSDFGGDRLRLHLGVAGIKDDAL